MDREIMNLSLISNQIVIIHTLCAYLTEKELDSIDLRDILNTEIDPNNDKVFVKREFESGTCIEFATECDLSEVPVIRLLKITITKGENSNIFLCNLDPKNRLYIGQIFGKAINKKKYKSEYSYIYNRREIIDGVSKTIASFADSHSVIGDLISIRGNLATEVLNTHAYDRRPNFKHIYSIGNCSVTMEWVVGETIKVIFSIDGKSNYIYTSNTDVGINIIMLILDKAIIILKEKYYI